MMAVVDGLMSGFAVGLRRWKDHRCTALKDRPPESGTWTLARFQPTMWTSHRLSRVSRQSGKHRHHGLLAYAEESITRGISVANVGTLATTSSVQTYRGRNE